MVGSGVGNTCRWSDESFLSLHPSTADGGAAAVDDDDDEVEDGVVDDDPRGRPTNLSHVENHKNRRKKIDHQ